VDFVWKRRIEGRRFVVEPATSSSSILQMTLSLGRLAGGDFSSTAVFNWKRTNMAIFYVMKQRGKRFYVMMGKFLWCKGDLQKNCMMLWYYLEFQRGEMWQHYSNKLSFMHLPDTTNFLMSQFGYRVRTRAVSSCRVWIPFDTRLGTRVIEHQTLKTECRSPHILERLIGENDWCSF